MSRTTPFELGLMFTHRCPLECRHCGIESGPDNFAGMDLALARRCIVEAARLEPRPTTIVFTGGEPMMYPDALEALLECCALEDLRTRVITSGFWARNADAGRRLLYRMRLAGLDALNFSADHYHLEFLEAGVVRRAFAIAQELGFAIVVNMVLNRTGDPVRIFADQYGIAEEDIRLLDGDTSECRDGCTDRPGIVHLSVGRLVGMGRAAHYPEDLLLGDLQSFGTSPCSEVTNRPVIYPDGTLQACCCAGGKLDVFRVGNVNEHALSDLLARMRARPHFGFINRFGPRSLFEALSEMENRPAEPDRKFASICDLCVAGPRGLAPERVDEALARWTLKRIVASDVCQA